MNPTATVGAPELALVQMRHDILEMCANPEGGHLGGSLSCLEMLAAIFAAEAPEPPALILSKGHSAIALYAVLRWVGELTQDQLQSFCRPGSSLSTHTNASVPGVSVSTGSLGHGLGIGAGWALATRAAGKRVYVVLGDGETQEGSVPEAARICGHLGLENLVALVDMNGAQQTGYVNEIGDLSDAAGWWASMGWHVEIVGDGNSLRDVEAMLRSTEGSGKPVVLLCRTTKGHGVSAYSGAVASHFVTINNEKLSEMLAALPVRGL